MRLVSGASLIFSAPKDKWIQILGRLNVSAETDDDLSEIIVSPLLKNTIICQILKKKKKKKM